MAEPATNRPSYADLGSLPENMTGEIIDGELIVTPRPSRIHSVAASCLGYCIGPPYQFGEGGGPGGWIIIMEPEIGLGQDVLVPDLAGWRKERFPREEPNNWISVVPDWVCEILSPATARTDRVKKMHVYARHGVAHAWLIDPMLKTLEVFGLHNGRWVVLGAHADDEKVRADPFGEIEIELRSLWLG